MCVCRRDSGTKNNKGRVMIKNPIYYLNQAEGIFYPAFDKYLCKDEQIE